MRQFIGLALLCLSGPFCWFLDSKLGVEHRVWYWLVGLFAGFYGAILLFI
jgi:hypothetical protein